MLLLAPLLAGCQSDYNPHPTGDDDPVGTPPAPVDRDEDGFTIGEGDCNDLDATMNPEAHEACDGKDNDCDEFVDGTGSDDLLDNACHRQSVFDQTMQADVLMVVSNAPSMQAGGYWDSAAAGAVQMARHLVGKGSKSHLGVVLDDLSERYDGRLLAPNQFDDTHWLAGDNDKLDPETLAAFYRGISDRDDPSESPRGMRAAVSDLVDAAQTPWNHGFFRPGQATLDLVFVSDAEDLNAPADEDFLTDLAHFAGTLDRVRIYAVTQSTPFDCAHQHTTEATSIVSLVEQTDGFYESVCMADWSGFMSGVGQDIARQSLQGAFPLDSPARVGTVVVTVELDQDKGTRLVWDPHGYALQTPTTLVFLDVRPPAGSTIYVDYLEDWLL